MPVITAERPVRVFIDMRNNFYLAACLLLLLGNCRSNNVTEAIPTGPVNITLDLNLLDNQHLIVPGSFTYAEGGVKGVLIIHDYDDTWHAYERTCAWQPLNACSQIWVDTQAFQLKCGTPGSGGFNKCCESRYMFNGLPLNGPAGGSLARYNVSRSGNLLLIYN
jgi:hypothetical protein